MSKKPAASPELLAAEAWFVRHGLPYFVDELRAQAAHGLARRVFLPVVLFALAVGGVAGFLVPDGGLSNGVLGGVLAAVGVLTLYGFARLKVGPMARWAIEHTFTSLGPRTAEATSTDAQESVRRHILPVHWRHPVSYRRPGGVSWCRLSGL